MESFTMILSNGDTKEKTIHLEMRFMDSLKFTLTSLDSLVKTLGKDQFRILTNQMLPQIPKESTNGQRHDRIESLKKTKRCVSLCLSFLS